jgi:hypothetical protein
MGCCDKEKECPNGVCVGVDECCPEDSLVPTPVPARDAQLPPEVEVRSVDLDGQVAVVGLRFPFKVDGYPENATEKTSVHVFSPKDGKWIENQVIQSDVGDDIGDSFGDRDSLAIHGDTIIIGDPRENELAGAAYIFALQEGVWTVQAKFSGEAEERYGTTVAIRGERVAIGNWISDGIGRVDIFKRSGAAWELEAHPMAPTFDEPNLDVKSFGDLFAFDDATDRLLVRFTVYDSDHGVSTDYAVVFQNSEGAWTQQGQHFGTPQAHSAATGDSFIHGLSMSEGAVALQSEWFDDDSHVHSTVDTFEYSQSEDQWMSTDNALPVFHHIYGMAMKRRRLVLYAKKEGGETSTDIYAQTLNGSWQLIEALPREAVYPFALSGDRIVTERQFSFLPSACVYSRPRRDCAASMTCP